MPDTISIKLGCGVEKELYQNHTGRAKATLTQYHTWQETFTVPERGSVKRKLTCPTCGDSFDVSLHSKSRARLRKLSFASIFLAIATGGILFGMFAGTERGLMGYSIGTLFTGFALWQSFNAIRGRLDATDLVTHGRGKTHRIFNGMAPITFSDGSTR